ncbi:protein MODIFIED TRANSPORT TO THE VACUOLE 1 isoform X1 [Nicotiana tomentosiformis]|uniref:protein MODIFIED TRANSPORT TO THE VACUOLE 1 isoform X1 n=1 Tax=Nicotiana tomentosiformis TaxID=4098 RepID=UPI00051C5737|nr:protein MODIFIED TRANSPORT TO THE VACUOLE 1 isoform X1 [Nicotiana tomentosiformis]
MDSSRRAVESYWRSRMIDGATSDEDKVTPVYKLEEISELLGSSHSSIVKEVSDFILKRLQHKSPIVKQKALRVIKYAVGKSGAEFRREMQRNSVAVRQLIHYKGQPDPLKGDSRNKAVRETAQEALSALFSSEESKPAPTETLGGRIQGFGNTNYEMPSDDKKSFLSEVVGIGSATIKQGLNTLSQSPSLTKNDTGNYRSPNLQRSLTTETDYTERYEGISSHSDVSRFSRNAASGSWSQDLQASQTETTNADSGLSSGEKTREEKLLEAIATSGGVRLQPTRDALQVFLLEASKLDALALTQALESKLQSPLWQVRVKAICVLEAILRKKDDEHFGIMASYFNENKDVVVKCFESPQASLREKANKVLSLLNDGQTADSVPHVDRSAMAGAPVVQMPDLIDTGNSDDLFGADDLANMQSGEGIKIASTSGAPLVDDLFGDNLGGGVASGQQKNGDDPFADVSFHTSNEKALEADHFSGMTFDKTDATEVHLAVDRTGPELFDMFGPSVEVPQDPNNPRKEIHDLMNSLSLNGNDSSKKQNDSSRGTYPDMFQESTIDPHQASNDALNSIFSSQAGGANSNPMFPLGAMQYNLPPGFVLNPSFAPQALNYNAMGNMFAQQQFFATLSSYQQLATMHPSTSASHAADSAGGYGSALPDIFNPSISNHSPTSLMNTSKKEDTKAFDFISDHLAAARDPKRVI